jgi:streptomycin 6-kinase
MFSTQQKTVPERLGELMPLAVHVDRLIEKVSAAKYWSGEGVAALRAAQQLSAPEGLVHGDLHPWNLFVSDRAQVIDPYGLRGDQGFDLAFLAASLAHDQEQFLTDLSEQLGLDTALTWFPGLVVYRLDNCIRHRTEPEGQVLKDLADRLFS